MGLTEIERAARAATRAHYRSIGTEIQRLRSDAGVSQRRLALAAGIDQGFLSRIEAATTRPSVEVLNRIAAALGADLSLRLYPNTGPPIRDRHQARMVEALLRILHPRWRPSVEVPVRRPARGVVDCVLDESAGGVVVAVEAESDTRRLEQQIRWGTEKAESLSSAQVWPFMSQDAARPKRISRLLLLRSTATSRRVARDMTTTLQAAFPAPPADAYRALTTATAPWPGATLLWLAVDGDGARVLERRPPGLGGD